MSEQEQFPLKKRIGILKGLLETTEQEIRNAKFGNILDSGTVQRDNIDETTVAELKAKAERLKAKIAQLELTEKGIECGI